MSDHPTQIKKIFLVASAVVVVTLIGTALIKERQNAKVIAGFDESLKLKTTADQILSITDYSGGDPNGVVKYTYVTDQKVPPETYKGLKEDLSKRTANAQIFLKSVTPISKKLQKEEYVGKFYSGKPFYNDGKSWRQTGVATTTKIAFETQTRPTLLAQTKKLLGTKVFADTFYAGAGDGHVNITKDSASFSWSTTRSSSVGTNAYPNLSTETVSSSKSISNGNFGIDRGFLPFDTSSIPANANISLASLNLYIINILDTGVSGFVSVVQTSQVDSSTLSTVDFDQCGLIDNPTKGATDIDLTGITINNYLGISLSSTGIDWIKKDGDSSNCGVISGVTCLGLREGRDIDNVEPSGIGNIFIFSTSEDSTGDGNDQDPFLEITYSTSNPAFRIDSVGSGNTVKIDSVGSGNTVKINSN